LYLKNRFIFLFLFLWVRIFIFFVAQSANFFPEINIMFYDKNSESDFFFFFSPPKSEYFFSNIGNQNMFLEKNHNKLLYLKNRFIFLFLFLYFVFYFFPSIFFISVYFVLLSLGLPTTNFQKFKCHIFICVCVCVSIYEL
jgi:hypothetical protein